MPESSDAVFARLVLQAGLATPEQLADAGKLVEQMKALGVKRDLLGALVDRKVLDQAAADDIRARATSQAGAADAEVVDAEVVDAEVIDAEVVDAEVVDDGGGEDELKVAPAHSPVAKGPNPQAPAPSGTGASFCHKHPGRLAVAFCSHCNRPVCVHCVIRTDKDVYCSETCAVGATAATDAASTVKQRAREDAMKLGGYVRWAAMIGILLGLVIVIKWFVDDYRFSFAMQKANNKGDTDKEGMAALKKAVALRPKRTEPRVRLGRAYLELGDAGLAIKQLERAIAHDPGSADAHHAIIEAYVAKDRFAEAARTLVSLRAIDAADSESERRLGRIYRDKLDSPKEAVEAFRRALRLGLESRELHYEIGTACFADGNLAEAKADLMKAVMPLASPDDPNAPRERGFLTDRHKMGRAYSLLITIAEKEGDPAALDAQLASAQAAVPGSAMIVTRRARLLMDLGRQKEALDALTGSYDVLQGSPEYLEFLGQLQSEAGAQEEALVTLRRLHKLAPDRPGSVEKLVAVEASVGDPARAMMLLESLPAERRTSEELLGVWDDVIRGQLSRGRVASAEKMLKNLGPKAEFDPRFASVWCEVLHRMGRDEEALERAELALRRDPENPAPHLVVGSVLRSLGRTREALARVRTAARLGAGGLADIEMALLYWQGGLKGEASRSFVKGLADKKLSQRKKLEAKAYLTRMRGSKGDSSYSSYIIKMLHSRLQKRSTSAARSVSRVRLATYGTSRSYGMLGGTIGTDPQPTEIDSIRKMSVTQHDQVDTESLTVLQRESDRMAVDAGRALKTLYPRAAGDISAAEADYGRRRSFGVEGAAGLAAAAVGHLAMLEAALRHHPRAGEIGPTLESAARKMEARKALAPGELQEAICADLAAVDLLAAAIEAGPGSFMFRADVADVLSDLGTENAVIADPLSQFGATRCALFRMLWIFTAQAQEMGSVPEFGGEAKGGAE